MDVRATGDRTVSKEAKTPMFSGVRCWIRETEQIAVVVYGLLGENESGVEACDESGAVNLH